MNVAGSGSWEGADPKDSSAGCVGKLGQLPVNCCGMRSQVFPHERRARAATNTGPAGSCLSELGLSCSVYKPMEELSLLLEGAVSMLWIHGFYPLYPDLGFVAAAPSTHRSGVQTFPQC